MPDTGDASIHKAVTVPFPRPVFACETVAGAVVTAQHAVGPYTPTALG